MAKTRTTTQRAPGGRFSWFALILLILAIVGFCLSLRPRGIGDQWRRTVKDLTAREGVLTLANKIRAGGTVTVTGTGDGASSGEAVFALPGQASLSVTGEEEFLITASDGKVTLTQGNDRASASLSNALAGFDASHYAEEEGTVSDCLRAFLLLTEERQDGAALTEPYEKAVRRRLPRAARSRDSLEDGFAAQKTVYTFDAKRLSAILKDWQKTLPEDKELRQWATDGVRTLYALENKSAPGELIARIEDLLSGKDGSLDKIAAGLNEGKGTVTVSFWTASNRVVKLEAAWELPCGGETLRGTAALDLGKDPAKAQTRSFKFTQRFVGDTETQITVTASDTVSENSKTGYVREASFALSDPGFRLLPAAEGDTGNRSLKVKFSWGKQRGDLGLRLVSDERTVQFRGEMTEYKAGKRADFVIRRVEVDGENRISGQSFAVSVRPGGTPAAAAASKNDLFRAPEPEILPETEPETPPETAQETVQP